MGRTPRPAERRDARLAVRRRLRRGIALKRMARVARGVRARAGKTAPAPGPAVAACASLPAVELRDACIAAAREVIAREGVEGLSLRDVARRLGVSHQAPYKHYPSRDHLLAEVLRRCFEQFAQHLDARRHFDDPYRDLRSLGRRYLDHARQHPLEYRLMFDTPWPAAARGSDRLQGSTRAFDILRQVLRRIHGDGAAQRERVDLDAIFVWSALHGLVGVMGGDAAGRLGLQPKVLGRLVQHVIDRAARGIGDAAAPR